MATQSIPQPVSPPMIPPALPPGLPPAASVAAPGTVEARPVEAKPDIGVAHPSGVAPAPLAEDSEPARLLLTPPQARMPVDLQVMIPVRDFRVRDLLAMVSGKVVESSWANGEDLPLSSGEIQLAWAEFEVVDSRLAVRVTRLA